MGTVYNTNIVTDGLIGCWDVGNRKSYPGTGDDWGDLVNSVTATGETSVAPLFSSEPWAGTFLLDGTDDYFAIPDADLEVVGAFTFSVWLRFTTATPAGSQGYVAFTIRGGSGWDAEFALSILNHSWLSQSVRVGCKGTSSQMGRWNANKYSPNENYNVWRNYCGVYNGSDPDVAANFKFYFDGVDAGTHDAEYQWGVTNNETRWAKDGADYGYMGGYLGTIHLHNRALTAAEIKQNYEAVKPRFVPRITKSGLVGNWDAGDPESYSGGSSTCKDTANGTTATFMNWDAGEAHFNSANGGYWEFDGTDQYIQCSTNSILQPQSFSVEAWVKDDQTEHYLPIVAWANAYYPAVWTSYHDSTQKPIIYMNSGDLRYFDSTAASVAGWHHVVFTYTYDDITTGAFYVDGVSIAVSSTYDDTKASTNTCTIGAALKTGGPQYYKGSMGLVRIYDTPLSAAEVMDNFQKTRGRFGV